MPRVLSTTAVLLLLSIVPSTAKTSDQTANEAAQARNLHSIQFALNPQPEPPNIPRTSDGTSGKKGKAKAIKQPKKGDPGH